MYLIREDINRKVSFSFGLCPNYLNRPPPLTPILATLSSFLDAFILHLKDQKKTKFSIDVFPNGRGCKCHRNGAITQSKAFLLWQKSGRIAKVLISLKYLCGGLLCIRSHFFSFSIHVSKSFFSKVEEIGQVYYFSQNVYPDLTFCASQIPSKLKILCHKKWPSFSLSMQLQSYLGSQIMCHSTIRIKHKLRLTMMYSPR